MLTGIEIANQIRRGWITIDPFDETLINPNSIDFRLSPVLRTYDDGDLDAAKDNPTTELVIPAEGLVLEPNTLYLGSTVETFATDHYVGVVEGKSSLGRLGLVAHLTAGFIDCGYKGQITLEITVVRRLRIYPNMRIGQMCYITPVGAVTLYRGKYQNQVGPQASRSYRDTGRYTDPDLPVITRPAVE